MEQDIRDGFDEGGKEEQREQAKQLEWKELLRELAKLSRDRWRSWRTVVEEGCHLDWNKQWTTWQSTA